MGWGGGYRRVIQQLPEFQLAIIALNIVVVFGHFEEGRIEIK
jgi:hypothetical protein